MIILRETFILVIRPQYSAEAKRQVEGAVCLEVEAGEQATIH